MLHAYKYSGKTYLSEMLVDLWLKRWTLPQDKIDAIIPVPLSAWREFRRGYNQAHLLAKALGRKMGKPVLSTVLRRTLVSRSQTKLKRAERLRNAGASYRLRKSRLPMPMKTVLLVDDVCTTGATLSACAALLKRIGVKRVIAATVAHDRIAGP